MQLIKSSEDFDRIARSRIFLDLFPRSHLRPAVFRLLAEAAEVAAVRLSRDASRKLKSDKMDAPVLSYFLNYRGLDRYGRRGVRFIFDAIENKFCYDGEAWREIVRRYPRSDEATEARKRLEQNRERQNRERQNRERSDRVNSSKP